jgi:hypothetical protein
MLVIGLATVSAFCIVVVAGGHGAGAVGMLLYYSLAESVSSEWLVVTVPVYAAIVAFLVATPLQSRRVHTRIFVVGLVALLFAWVNVLGISEAKLLTFASSVPFLPLAAALGILIRGPDVKARPQTGPRGFDVVQLPNAQQTVVSTPPPAVTSSRARRNP